MTDQLKSTIQSIVGVPVQTVTPLSGGMISEVLKIDFQTHPSLVAKTSEAGHDLTIEAYMLEYLKNNSDLPIPDVIHADENLMLIEFIESSVGLNHAIQAHIGELLGQLHLITASQYGLERDTLIGPIHQPNPLSDSWIEFFREHRLLYMADIALQSGNLSQALYDRLQSFAEKVDSYLIEPKNPVLIHGDIWTTNVLTKNNKVVGIIDPAIYYAHNEMELQYLTVFGNFGQAFFDRYQQFIPVDDDFFNVRRYIYNLYPLLVHVAIFGGRYPDSVDSVLRRFQH